MTMSAVARMRQIGQNKIVLKGNTGEPSTITPVFGDEEFDKFIVNHDMTIDEATLMFAKQLAMYRIVVNIDSLPEAIRDSYVDYLRTLVTANRIVLEFDLPTTKTSVDVESLANGDS